MDEARLLGSGNDPHVDARLTRDRRDELAAVFRLAHGARGRRDDLVHLVRLGQPAILRKDLERGRHRGVGQVPAVEAAGAEPDHVLFAVDDLEREVGVNLHDDHVDRVGADVYGSDAHGVCKPDGTKVRLYCRLWRAVPEAPSYVTGV